MRGLFALSILHGRDSFNPVRPRRSLVLLGVTIAFHCFLFSFTTGAQYFDLHPTVHLSEVPRFTVPFTIELRIHNAGPDQAVGVVVNHTVPAGLNLISAEVYGCIVSGGGSYCYDPENPVSTTINGNSLQFHAGRIPAGTYRPIFIRVVGPNTGTFTTQTSISPMPWELPGNNSIAYPVEVRSYGLVVKTGSFVPEQTGTNAVFTVQVVPACPNLVTANYTAIGTTATAGEDFTAVSGSLSFPPGVTNRTVVVPVLDDTVHEPFTEAFTLLLTNAVNAEVDPNPQPSYVVDDEPALEISLRDAAPVLEGDGQTTTSVFEVQLSGRADVPISIDYTAGPPVAQTGTVVIPAGATSGSLNITFTGNLSVETNRSFAVTLTNLRGTSIMTFNPATARGTIIDDDGIPGKLHHLVVDTVPSPQLAGRPIPVTLRALDYQENPATNFAGVVNLAAYDISGKQPSQYVDVSNFVAGVTIGNVTYTNATTNAYLTAWLWMGSYYVTASAGRIRVNPQPTLFLSLPGSGTEGQGIAGAGLVSITNVDVQDVQVQLLSGDDLEISLPPTVTIPAGQTSVVFNVTIVDDDRLDATHSTGVAVTSPGYIGSSGSISVADNETATLSLNLPDGFSEGGPILNGTVSVSRPVAVMVQVALSSSDPAELRLAPFAFIPAGETNGSFWIVAGDDGLMDGTKTATITAHVPNWTDAIATGIVSDNDTNLNVSINFENKSAYEGVGTVANAVRVQLPGISPVDVTVQLSSSDTSEAVLPASVVIRAGQLSVVTNLTVVDDAEFDGNQLIAITASSPGLNPSTRTFTVYDNDPHHFVFNTISSPQTSGVPFQIRFTARDVNNTVISYFTGPVTLAAITPVTTLPLTPSFTTNYLGLRNLSSWGENVTITGWGTNIQIMASTPGGASSLSNPFTVAPPAAVANARIGRIESQADSVRLYFDTVAGFIYRVEHATNLPTTQWTLVGVVQIGTGGEMSVSDSAGIGQRFYRLSISP